MVLQIDKLCEYSSSLLTRLQARKELNRIEERYVKRNNRNIWKSDAEYVDGEYVYSCRTQVAPPQSRSRGKKSDDPSPTTPSKTKSPSSSASRPPTDSSSSSEASKRSGVSTSSKLAKRFSTSMPWR